MSMCVENICFCIPKSKKIKEMKDVLVIYIGEGRKIVMSKIDVEKQLDLKDCGACSLSCIIKYYKGYVPIEKIREDTVTNSNGTTAYHLINAAKSYGFDAIGIKADDILDSQIYLPAIVHLQLPNGLQHFAVIYKVNKSGVWLMDPAKGKVKLKLTEFLKIWDNIIILLSPVTDIVNIENNLTIKEVFISLISQNKSLFMKIILISIILMITSILGNFYFQIAISGIQDGTDINFMKFIVIVFFILFLFKVILDYVKNYYLNYMNKNLDTNIFYFFFKHIFNLPLKFMQNRTTGEIVTRAQELNDIKNLVADVFTNIILNSILMLAAIVVLYFINARLFFVLCLIISIYILVSIVWSKTIYRKLDNNIQVATDFNSILVENIEMNTSIKNLNLTKEFLIRLEDKLILMLKDNFLLQHFFNNIEALKNFIYEMGLFAIMSFGIYLIAKGELQVLNLVTFNSIIIYLFDPIKSTIDLIPKYNYLKVSFKKISEFINLLPEIDNEGLNIFNTNLLEMENVNYSYNRFSNVLNDVNFKINPGEKVLLSGPSGCGKSTICNLLYRNYFNYSGKIKISNMSEKDYTLETIRKNILYVGQEETLFTGTIRDNIICYRDVLEEDYLEVLKICKIEEIVDKKPNRYNSIINASLNNLSGGEKQRIILARSLLKKAKILILDEALSEVNEMMEREILDNIFLNYQEETLIYVTHKNVSDKFQKVINIGEKND